MAVAGSCVGDPRVAVVGVGDAVVAVVGGSVERDRWVWLSGILQQQASGRPRSPPAESVPILSRSVADLEVGQVSSRVTSASSQGGHPSHLAVSPSVA